MRHLVSVALVAGLWSGGAWAETLKISSYLPPSTLFNVAVEEWADEVKEQSSGALDFEIYPSSQLGPVQRQFDLVKNGAADIAIVLHSATPGRFPLTELAGLPLSYPSAGDSSAISSERLTALAPEFLAPEHEGTKILWMAVTPPLKINLGSKRPGSLDDLKGLRIRYAGKVFQEVVDVIGATPMPVPPGETADSLAKGIIDGAMFPYEAVKAYDIGPELDYSLEPGVASATFAVVMNQRVYDALSPDLRRIIDDASGLARARQYGAQWDKGEGEARTYLIEHDSVKVVTLEPGSVKNLHELVASIIQKNLKAATEAGLPAQEFFSAYTK